jgi:hypothetical protein
MSDRQEKIKWADHYLSEARDIARWMAWLDRECDGEAVPAGVLEDYAEDLAKSECRYRAAGLSLLAGRVRWLRRQTIYQRAWFHFDKLNSGMAAATEGGAK